MVNPAYNRALAMLDEHNITLNITRKRIKNINFRIKVGQLYVSAPRFTTDIEIAYALHKRLDWILNVHQKLVDKQANSLKHQPNPNQPIALKLWGETQNQQLNENQRLTLYRQELNRVMPALFDKWQPIVGKKANEYRIKKMKTRWGSCNTKAKRVWLSVYLPEYPLKCTEYVVVHELCHLHHANHSPKFWSEVAKAMPEYKKWHDLLAGKTGIDL